MDDIKKLMNAKQEQMEGAASMAAPAMAAPAGAVPMAAPVAAGAASVAAPQPSTGYHQMSSALNSMPAAADAMDTSVPDSFLLDAEREENTAKKGHHQTEMAETARSTWQKNSMKRFKNAETSGTVWKKCRKSSMAFDW